MTTSGSSSEVMLRTLLACGVTHVIGVPDNMSAALITRMRAGSNPRYLAVTREGEAFAIAAGLWLGGKVPAVLIQNTGLLESGDAVRGTAARMGAPLVILVTGRGYAKLRASDGKAAARPLTRESLVRPDVDSVALMTEATLDAWGIPYMTWEGGPRAEEVLEAFTRAAAEQRPVAVLLTRALT